MYYLIYGDDTYRSRAHFKKLSDDLGKNAEIFYYDAASENVASAVEEHARGGNLFGGTLVCVMYPFSGTKENSIFFDAHIGTLAAARAVFLLWDTGASSAAPKKRKGGRARGAENGWDRYAALAEKSVVFSMLSAPQCAEYISRMAEERRVSLSEKDLHALARYAAGDLWIAHHELEKYALTDAFEFQKKTDVQETLFAFTDALAVGDREGAFRLLEGARAGGFDEVYIVAALAGVVRTMLQIKSIAAGSPDYRAYEALGIHPFVLKKTLSHVRRFRIDDLKRLYAAVARADASLKSGDADADSALVLLSASF